jgi:hypothetical protein
MPLVLLICGGRTFGRKVADYAVSNRALEQFVRARGVPDQVVVGDAAGADDLGRQWAVTRGIPTKVYHADWRRFGNSAGPMRNQLMIKDGKPTVVIAFPGGKGTNDCVARAKYAGIEVLQVMHDYPYLRM